jgi:hypothetical protein
MALVFAHVEDGHDVAMEELGGDFRLPMEALARFLLVFEVSDDHLQRDLPIRRFVVRGEDQAGGTAANPLEQAIVTQLLDFETRSRSHRHRSAS